MWIGSLSKRLARIALSACVLFSVTNAWGSISATPHGINVATKLRRAGQGGRKGTPPPAPQPSRHATDDYIIGPSDILNINVWKDPELTRVVTVRPDGRITLPLIGELPVSGLTAMNVQLLVTKRLKDYVSDPEVTVIVQEVKSQTYIVVGKVVKPGSFDLGKPTTVLEAIAIAGGFLDFAKTNKVYVLRRQEDGTQIRLPFDYKKVINQHASGENVDLKNGDTIVVP